MDRRLVCTEGDLRMIILKALDGISTGTIVPTGVDRCRRNANGATEGRAIFLI
jgi:hypothetical protein